MASPRGPGRLSARSYYGIIVSGVVLGVLICGMAGWGYAHSSDARPTGRRIWETDAKDFVVPVCIMIGATFGGLAGVFAAIGLDQRRR
jgi:hypothetical protein